jgi:hypothetical protein
MPLPNVLRGTAAMVLVVGLSGCAEDEPETAVEAFEEGGEERVELVTGEPFEATATVDDVVGDHVFVVLDTLVVTDDPVAIHDGDLVRVTGEVEDGDELTRRAQSLGEDERQAIADADLVVAASEVEVVSDRAE